jgi:inner membrane protein
MDTITHGIAGALIAKAAFGGDDLFALRPMNARRIVTWSLMTGAIFPDIDTLRDFFSRNELLMITWHRSITHSLLCLPIFALLLAALTRGVCSYLEWESPSFVALSGIYAVGIASHIFLDLVTTFGTMIWSPLGWKRPAWDLIFIIDFTLSALLLLPQFLAWVYTTTEKWKRRALGLWLVSELVLLSVAAIAQIVGAPISVQSVVLFSLLLTIVVFLPAGGFWGMRISPASWNRAGLLVAGIYIALAVYAHHAAVARARSFVALLQLDAESLGALPLPPSVWHWDVLIKTPHGIYDWRIDLSQKSPVAAAPSSVTGKSGSADDPPLKYSFYPEAYPNAYVARARQLPEVQKVLWFARFPLTRFHKEGDDAVVEFSDKRFPQIRPDRPAPFTYRVRFGAKGDVVSQGWER